MKLVYEKDFEWEQETELIKDSSLTWQFWQDFERVRYLGWPLAPSQRKVPSPVNAWVWVDPAEPGTVYGRLEIHWTFDVLAMIDESQVGAQPGLRWMMENYEQCCAAVAADPFLTGGTVKLYAGGAGSD